MSKLKEDGRALVEVWINDPCDHDGDVYFRTEARENSHSTWAHPSQVHPHPGVPVADLVRECELAAVLINGDCLTNEQVNEYDCLVAARTATTKPKFQEGQEVWVRATACGERDPKMGHLLELTGTTRVNTRPGWRAYFSPEDIRTDAPHGAKNPHDSA